MNSSSQEQAAAQGDMHSSLRIRAMRLEDIPAVHSIDVMSFSMPWPESSFRYELLENRRSVQRVAEMKLSNGSWLLIGEVVVWMVIDEAHIATLAVHPDYRGRGISKLLLVSVLVTACHQGMRVSTLEVRESNAIAQNLYSWFGFTVVGSRPRYYKDNNEDALIMTVNGLDAGYMEWLESGAWQSAPFKKIG
jgi:ribosomal-protein-alanine N-acetyltransferase